MVTSPAPPRPPLSSARWALLAAHAAVVAALTTAALIVIVAPSPEWGATDATFVLAIFALPLLALGMPWSLGYFVVLFIVGLSSRGDDPAAQRLVADTLVAAALIAPAMVNVVLHARWLLARRRRQQHPEPS